LRGRAILCDKATPVHVVFPGGKKFAGKGHSLGVGNSARFGFFDERLQKL
jgi:hypothetical protein